MNKNHKIIISFKKLNKALDAIHDFTNKIKDSGDEFIIHIKGEDMYAQNNGNIVFMKQKGKDLDFSLEYFIFNYEKFNM